MKNIFLIGAGRSASTLIKYLAEQAVSNNYHVSIGDINLDLAKKVIKENEHIRLFNFDIKNKEQRQTEIKKADLVISMLPAFMHTEVAKECIEFKKHMVTASYVSEEMKALHLEATKKGLIFMNEIGVDPGLDHLSAMRVIDNIRNNGGKMREFETFTGGLIAPESDNNPWNYKFTWNPRNVVLAGSGGPVKFIQEGQYKYIPYQKLFRRTEIIDVEGFGKFEGYANRDSLKYREVYNLQDILTLYRGTLRRPGFCRAWDLFVQLGLTDDSYTMENTENMTYRQYLNSFLAYHPSDRIEIKLMQYLGLHQDDTALMEKLEWLDLFSNKKIGLKNVTPAQILQHILEDKWKMEAIDKDMIVMWHKFVFWMEDDIREIQSSMVIKGDDNIDTAMAKTVGLPVGIASKLILNGKINKPGVHIPITSDIYTPILNELENYGITFNEKIILR